LHSSALRNSFYGSRLPTLAGTVNGVAIWSGSRGRFEGLSGMMPMPMLATLRSQLLENRGTMWPALKKAKRWCVAGSEAIIEVSTIWFSFDGSP
jgi:hypothetical protein